MKPPTVTPAQLGCKLQSFAVRRVAQAENVRAALTSWPGARPHSAYAVALALGEIDPHYEGKQAIIAYAGGEPSASMSSLRLVVPSDPHGGGNVRDIATIELR